MARTRPGRAPDPHDARCGARGRVREDRAVGLREQHARSWPLRKGRLRPRRHARAGPQGRQRLRRRPHDGITAHTMNVKRLSDIDVAGKRVFIRADLNVPQDDAGAITDDTRIRASVPGIRDALARGAAVMVTSHLGRPSEGKFTTADSLRPGARRRGELLGRDVPLVRDWVDGGAWHDALRPGDVVLLENCRFNPGEKKDDEALARRMASLCDVY